MPAVVSDNKVLTPYPRDFVDQLEDVPEWLKGYSGTPLALVFGCGPSLDDMPPGFWWRARNYLSCMVNGFPLIMDPVKVHYFCADIWLCIDAIRDQDKSENYFGLRKIWESKPPREKPLRLMAGANRSSVITDLFFEHTTKMERRRGYCKYGRSSVQAACHWLINEVSPKRIVLFGVDYKGAGRAGGYEGNASHQPGRKLEETFAEMYEGALRLGTEILNASPGTGLRAIPRVEWQEIMK